MINAGYVTRKANIVDGLKRGSEYTVYDRKMAEKPHCSQTRTSEAPIVREGERIISNNNLSYIYKEKIVISGGSNNVEITDFKILKINNLTYRNYNNNYGALNIWKEFHKFVNNEITSPVSLNDGIEATMVTLAIQKSLKYNGKIQKL